MNIKPIRTLPELLEFLDKMYPRLTPDASLSELLAGNDRAVLVAEAERRVVESIHRLYERGGIFEQEVG